MTWVDFSAVLRQGKNTFERLRAEPLLCFDVPSRSNQSGPCPVWGLGPFVWPGEGRLSQEQMLGKIGDWSNAESLAKALNKSSVNGGGWIGGMVSEEKTLELASKGVPLPQVASAASVGTYGGHRADCGKAWAVQSARHWNWCVLSRRFILDCQVCLKNSGSAIESRNQ